MAVAVGNLWFVCAIGCNVNVANRTKHKFPNATPTGVPCKVKSTDQLFTFFLAVYCAKEGCTLLTNET